MNRLFVFLFVSFLAVHIAMAQQTSVDTITLKAVTITSQKMKESDVSASPMQSIRIDEIQRISGLDVSDAVRLFSGIALKDYGGVGGMKTVMVRSLGANHTSVFIDGVKINDIASGQIDLGKILLFNTDEISLNIGHSYNKCKPASYYSSASVISVSSAMPDTSKKNELHLGYRHGSWGLSNPYLLAHKRIGKRSNLAFAANMIKSDGNYPYKVTYGSLKDSVLHRVNSDLTSYQLHINFISVFKDSSHLSLKIQYDEAEKGLPGAVMLYNPHSKQRMFNKDFLANVRYENHKSHRINYLLISKYARNFLNYKDPDYLNNHGGINNKYTQEEYFLSSAFLVKATSSLKLSLANDVMLQKLVASNLNEYPKPQRLTSMHVVAASYLYEALELNAHLLGAYINEKADIANSIPTRMIADYSASLAYKISNSPHLRLRLLHSKNFRLPTFQELYYSLVGNSNLLPENAKQFNVGLLGQYEFGFIDYMSFKVDFFHNEVDNKIVATPSKNLFVWSMRNIAKAHIDGVELQVSAKTKEYKSFLLSANFNYTYQSAKDMTQKGSSTYKQQIPYIPFETLSSMSAISYKKLTLAHTFVFNGHCFVFGENTFENMLPSWTTHDISLSYTVPIHKSFLNIKAEVSNVFNQQYEIIRNFPMQGQFFGLNISIKI